MIKTCIKQMMCIAASIFAVAAWAAQLDDYTYFQEVGVLDPGVSAEAANALVAAGISSGDPEVVDATIRALGEVAWRRAHGVSGPDGPLPERMFSDVDGLRDFLIAHWRREHEKSGFDSSRATRLARERFEESLAHLDSPTEIEDIVKRVEQIRRVAAPWPRIPQIVCVFWPGDPKVLELLWENQQTAANPNVSLQTLALLDIGKFSTPEAKAFRLGELRAALESDEETASITAMHVAGGPDLSGVPGALELMIAAYKKFPSAKYELMIAFGNWDEDELKGQKRALAPIVEDYRSLRPLGADVEARDRLRSVLGIVPAPGRRER